MLVPIDLQMLSTWFFGLIPYFVILILVMLIDFAGGALLAWYQGKFDLEKAPEFLKTGLLFFWVWITAEFLALLPKLLATDVPNYGDALAQWTPKVVYGTIVVAKYMSGIVKNWKVVFSMIGNDK